VSPTDYMMSTHVTKSPRPSPSIFAYCKQSNTGGGWPQNEAISKVCIPLTHASSHPQPAIAVLLSQNHCNLYTSATIVYADVKCRDVISLGASDLLKVYVLCASAKMFSDDNYNALRRKPEVVGITTTSLPAKL